LWDNVAGKEHNLSDWRVPMSAPDISDIERDAVADVLRTPVLSMGKQTEAFEDAVRQYSGAKHAIAVSSGTAGLHLCVRAANIGAPDLVLTSPYSFIASSNVLLYEHAVPIFVDVEKSSGNLDVGQLAEAVKQLSKGLESGKKWLPRKGYSADSRLRGILAVDIFGQAADFETIRELGNEYGLAIIEDSCEAIGAEYQGHKAGVLGDSGVFAFYPNKQMTTGEGGVVVTNDDAMAAMMRSLRNQGRGPGDAWLQHKYLGYNYRMTELSAVLGRVQIERLDGFLEQRAKVAGWYAERLADLDVLELPQLDAKTTRMSWFLYVVRIAQGIDRDNVINALDEAGIPSRAYFTPIHLQPFMVEKFDYRIGDFPVTEDLGSRSLALPFSSVMTEDQVDLVCSELKEILK
jgi:dTDP-4-amino-4,6-dideoxygalactose transaminase